MTTVNKAVAQILETQAHSRKPLAVILAGHNGSGKSTFWYHLLANRLQIPLINADRMMLSVLPESVAGQPLPSWARSIRDTNTSWMQVAQNGVQAFVSHAMAAMVPFAMETVFSHWVKRADGTHESKIDLIEQMQAAGYFVLLIFVGLTSKELSIARVQARVAQGGHDVPIAKIEQRFARTQNAISVAARVSDATIMVDNSRARRHAFMLCRAQLRSHVLFDIRTEKRSIPAEIAAWLDRISPTSNPTRSK